MTIQIDPDGFLDMLRAEGVTPNDELQLQLNNLNEMLARMPNFTRNDLMTVLEILIKGLP